MSFDPDTKNISEMTKRENELECSRWTQTTLTFPPTLPNEVEEILSRYCLFNPDRNIPTIAQPAASPLTQKVQPLSRSYSRIASLVSNTSGKLFKY